MGKHKPTYLDSVISGDPVVVINARHLVVTGRKRTQKKYFKYSGYPGGLHELRFYELMEKDPTEPLRLAVKRMLPKNRLQKGMLARLYIYPDGEHPHAANRPQLIPPASKGARLGALGEAPSDHEINLIWREVARFIPPDRLDSMISQVEFELQTAGTSLIQGSREVQSTQPPVDADISQSIHSGTLIP